MFADYISNVLPELGEETVNETSMETVADELLDEIFRKHRSMPVNERVRQVVREVARKVGNQYNYDLTPEDRKHLKSAIEKMLQRSTLRETCKGFYTWLGEPDLFRTAKNSKLEYADVFPLIYLKMKLEGVRSPYRKVKHLLIDEMQDYTPVQYAVIDRLFNCRKTILGDADQSVNPYNASTSEDIGRAFRTSARVTLNKSYRSSYEIMQFAQRISPNPDLEPIARHGEEPRVLSCGTRAKELEAIRTEVAASTESDFNTLGVICKTRKQARRTYDALQGTADRIHLLTEESRTFARGLIVCTAHIAKGLEFDQVVVPEANATNYQTPMDRNLLYVACTRAMHRLVLTHTGAVTPLA